jgi:predicted AAA+ superfamily ATPase
MHMIKRYLETRIKDSLDDGLVTIIYGARQVGKTTLAKKILAEVTNGLYLDCDDPGVVNRLQNTSLSNLKAVVGDADLIVIDEAQRIQNIGITAKLLHDNLPEKKLLLTGSSSLDIANKIKEPLTGRSIELTLYPLSIKEVANNLIEADQALERILIYGGYPGLWTMPYEKAATNTRNIANHYLYRDAFALGTIYDQTVMDNLLRLVAHQIGNEVSYSELASHLEISKETVMRYVDLLEKAFIIFRRPQYRKNKRALIGRLRKIYFYDLGMRNALIDDFRPLNLRNDIGQLWENFILAERIKMHQRNNTYVRNYYWRSRDNNELDLVEEIGKNTTAYECKYKKTAKLPVAFSKEYPNVSFYTINSENYWSFL